MDNLSAEMIQCKKDGFGCHYGKWKALQGAKPIPKPELPDDNISYCLYCGKKFVNKSGRKRFCDHTCSNLHNYYQNRERYLAKARRIRERKQENGETESDAGKDISRNYISTSPMGMQINKRRKTK